MDDKVARREMKETGATGWHLRRKLFAIFVVHMKTLSKIKRNLGAAVASGDCRSSHPPHPFQPS